MLHSGEDFVHVQMFGDEVANEGDLFRVVRAYLHGEIVDLGSHFVTVLPGEQNGKRHLADDVERALARAQVAGQDDSRQTLGAAVEQRGRYRQDNVFTVPRGDQLDAFLLKQRLVEGHFVDGFADAALSDDDDLCCDKLCHPGIRQIEDPADAGVAGTVAKNKILLPRYTVEGVLDFFHQRLVVGRL